MEAIGDITASAEVSQLPVHGEEFDTRIQGGILVSNPGLTRRYLHRSCYLGRWSGRLLIGAFHGYPIVRVCPGALSPDICRGLSDQGDRIMVLSLSPDALTVLLGGGVVSSSSSSES